MSSISFSAKIKILGVNPYIAVSVSRAKQIKPRWRKPLPVIVRINGEPKNGWRINMMPKGDRSFYLYLHGTIRKASSTTVGNTVEVEIRFDESYRNGPMHPLPLWFRTALNLNSIAKNNWKLLPPSRKKEILRYFASLKSDEARNKNLHRAMRVLSGKKERFMGRDWNK